MVCQPFPTKKRRIATYKPYLAFVFLLIQAYTGLRTSGQRLLRYLFYEVVQNALHFTEVSRCMNLQAVSQAICLERPVLCRQMSQ